MERPMRTIILASRKGGAGKTTLTCHLAVEAERRGHGPVGIIDTDDMAGLAKWWDAREAEAPVLARADPNLDAALGALRGRGCNLVLVDTPPAVSGTVAAAIAIADLVVIPVQATPDDLRAVGVTVQAAEAAGKPLLFVINRVKPRARRAGLYLRSGRLRRGEDRWPHRAGAGARRASCGRGRCPVGVHRKPSGSDQW
jgi:chromosome partitioning protein